MDLSRRYIVLLAVSLCSLGTVAGQQWPRFRGSGGAGHSDATTIPAVWTAQDYNWRVEVPGTGHSSPVVSGQRVFVMSAIQEDATRIIRCLRSEDGDLLWEVRFPSSPSDLGRATSYDKASPAVDTKRLYVAWGSPRGYMVQALDIQDGKEVWRRDLGSYQAAHGFGPSPILFEDLLILANDQSGPSSVVALDRLTGRTRWEVERRSGKAPYSTPIIYRPGETSPQLILASTSHGVSSLDARTGTVNWEVGDLFEGNRVVGSPVAAGGLIFAHAGLGSGTRKMFAIRPPDPVSGREAQVAYELEGSLPYVPTPVAHGQWLFLISDRGVGSCLDIETGRRVWRERIGGNFYGSPVRAGNRIYSISMSGELVVLAASPTYRLLGRVDLEEPSYSTPAIAGGVMYLRTFSHLMAIGGNAGSRPAAAERP